MRVSAGGSGGGGALWGPSGGGFFRTCVLPGWVAGLILWGTSSLASGRLDSGTGPRWF